VVVTPSILFISSSRLDGELIYKVGYAVMSSRPSEAVVVAMGRVTALVPGSKVKPGSVLLPPQLPPGVVGHQVPGLVVHVGEPVVEMGADMGVNVVNVKLS
jgi:hypothetical protein